MATHKRWKLRELIRKLEDLAEKYPDNIPVIIDSEFDDYLYDIEDVSIGTYYGRKNLEYPYVSINLYDNTTPIRLDKPVED